MQKKKIEKENCDRWGFRNLLLRALQKPRIQNVPLQSSPLTVIADFPCANELGLREGVP